MLQSLALSTPAVSSKGFVSALKSPSFALAMALVLQSLAFALERRELLLEKWLSRPLPLRSMALKVVALRTLVHTPKDLALAMTSLSPVLKSLACKPRPPASCLRRPSASRLLLASQLTGPNCPPRDLFCWTLVPSNVFASWPQPSRAVMVSCTRKPGMN